MIIVTKTVYFQVYSQNTHTHRMEGNTHITLERLLSRVGPHVLVQSPFLAEGLVTLAALIRLLLQQHTHIHNSDS